MMSALSEIFLPKTLYVLRLQHFIRCKYFCCLVHHLKQVYPKFSLAYLLSLVNIGIYTGVWNKVLWVWAKFGCTAEVVLIDPPVGSKRLKTKWDCPPKKKHSISHFSKYPKATYILFKCKATETMTLVCSVTLFHNICKGKKSGWMGF